MSVRPTLEAKSYSFLLSCLAQKFIPSLDKERERERERETEMGIAVSGCEC